MPAGIRPISSKSLTRGQIVVGWVTTSESWLVYVFALRRQWYSTEKEIKEGGQKG